MPGPLTRRERQLFELIRGYDMTHGCMPSDKWLADKLGISPRTVQAHRARLVEKGVLTHTGWHGRYGIALAHRVCPHCGRPAVESSEAA